MLNMEELNNKIQPLMNMGKYEEALQECIKTLNNNPDQNDETKAQLSLLMGRIYHRAGYISEAAPFFELAFNLDGNNPEISRRVDMFRRVSALLPNSRTDIENFIDPDIILIQAPGWGVNTPPLGTAMLTSFARNNGYKVLPIDLNIEFYLNRQPEFNNAWELEQSLWFWKTANYVKTVMNDFKDQIELLIDLILDANAPVVGFTIYESSLYVSLELARMLKAKKPDIKIIFGGPHVSRFIAGSSVIKQKAVDAAAQGEGELVLINVIEKIKARLPLTECPGLLVRVEDKVIDTGDCELIKDLNLVPAPDFSDYSFEKYKTPSRLPIMSSRGCANRCIYCNERPFWKKFRYRSAENVFEEIKAQIQRYPFINFLDFQDSLVNGVIRELDRLADLIIESGLKLQWAGQAVIRKEMTVELMTKLKKSGCVCLAYGLETPSSSLMLKVGKVMSRGANVNSIAEAHGQTGLGATYNLMFGLPGETEEDAFESLEFLRRNKKNGLVVNPSSSFCGFSPGTLAYESPEKYNIDFSKGGLYWETTDRNNTYLRRLKRFEDFCRLVKELGIQTTYPATILLDRNRALGYYFRQEGENERARWYFKKWLEEHPNDLEIKKSYSEVC